MSMLGISIETFRQIEREMIAESFDDLKNYFFFSFFNSTKLDVSHKSF